MVVGALAAGADSLAAVIVGVISGIGGGIIRDMMANRIPEVLTHGHFRASGAFVGAALYVFLLGTSIPDVAAAALSAALIFGVRSLSIFYGWGFPTIATWEPPRSFHAR